MVVKYRDYDPIKGPRNRYGAYSIMLRKERYWNTQPKPYVRPLPYRSVTMSLTSIENSYETAQDALSVLRSPEDYASLDQKCYNKAYENWASKLRGDAAELLTLWVERRKAFDMIGQRSLKLALGFIAAKRGDVRTLKRLWGKGAGVRQNLRKGGSHVLEYSFGWAPLVGDISNAVGVFGNGVPSSKVSAVHQVKTKYRYPPTNSGYTGFRSDVISISWRLGAHVSISDPNVALANQLGLLNPVATLWEVTPWSFVVDYFVNVQSFIGSFTDRLGFNIQNEYATRLMVADVSVLEVPPRSLEYRFGYTGRSVHVERKTVIARPTLSGRPPWTMSMNRAATSVALLLQQLKGK